MQKRETIDYDVVIVGGGPAGLSAAIRAKQLGGDDVSVCVLEKSSEIGGHILSGAVMDPIGLDALIPDWRDRNSPLKTKVKQDRYFLLGEQGQLRIPNFLLPPLMSNHGAYIVSLGNVCRWLAEYAENLGVEVFPGMAASEILYGKQGEVEGVVAGVFGLEKDGTHGESTEPGMDIIGKYVLVAEGARGSLAKQIIDRYKLDKDSDSFKFGLGMKELWEIDPSQHTEGQVTHTMGWPLGAGTGGGGFMYHSENNQVAIGFVVHLNYKNPYISPYKEFQRYKHHPLISRVLSGGQRISYGARAIAEGGWQSLPKMTFPGGILIGCAAGLVNVPRIKGSHNAILSGKLAAEAVYDALQNTDSTPDLSTEYTSKFHASKIASDLKRVRNVKPLWSRCGLLMGGIFIGGIDMWCASILKFNLLGTLRHKKPDSQEMLPASKYKVISYPKPDGKLSFDMTTNIAFSFTNHEKNQPVHLKLKDDSIPISTNLPLYQEPAQRYCPAGVYEVVTDKKSNEQHFVINFQNCLHCKTCDIKDPSENIVWTVPQGGDGPNYPNM